MTKKIIHLSSFFLFFMAVGPQNFASAEVGVGTNVFSRGRVRTSATAAMGTAFNQSYAVVGVGVGYMIARGLELGVDGEGWFGDNPEIYKLEPAVRYVFANNGKIFPYVGAFYSRTYYSNSIPDSDALGGRAGFFSRMSQHTFLGLGVVHEEYQDCDTRTYESCSATYPEISISIWY